MELIMAHTYLFPDTMLPLPGCFSEQGNLCLVGLETTTFGLECEGQKLRRSRENLPGGPALGEEQQ